MSSAAVILLTNTPAITTTVLLRLLKQLGFGMHQGEQL